MALYRGIILINGAYGNIILIYTSILQYYFNFMTHIVTFKISSCHSSYPNNIWDLLMSFILSSCHSNCFMTHIVRTPQVIQAILMAFEISSSHSYCPHAIQDVIMTLEISSCHSRFSRVIRVSLMSFEIFLIIFKIHSCRSRFPHNTWDVFISCKGQ